MNTTHDGKINLDEFRQIPPTHNNGQHSTNNTDNDGSSNSSCFEKSVTLVINYAIYIWDRLKRILVICYNGCIYFLSECFSCIFDSTTGCCSQQQRSRLVGSFNSLNLRVLWNGIKLTYNRWPAASILSILSIISFICYLIFIKIDIPGADQLKLISEINGAFLKGGLLMFSMIFCSSGFIMLCGNETLNLYSVTSVSTLSVNDTYQQQQQQQQGLSDESSSGLNDDDDDDDDDDDTIIEIKTASFLN